MDDGYIDDLLDNEGFYESPDDAHCFETYGIETEDHYYLKSELCEVSDAIREMHQSPENTFDQYFIRNDQLEINDAIARLHKSKRF
jgi:hypothetical protein